MSAAGPHHFPGGRPDVVPFPAARAARGGPRPLRPAVRRLRPRAGADRGRVLLPDHREVRGQRGPDVPHARDRDQGGARPTWSSTTSTSCGTTTSSRSTSRPSPTSTSCSGTPTSRCRRSRPRRASTTPRSCSSSSTRSTPPGRPPAARARRGWPAGPADRPLAMTAQGPRPVTGPRHVRGLAAERAASRRGSPARGGSPSSRARWSRRSAPATGCSSIPRRAAGRVAGRSSCSASPSRACWPSSASSGGPATGCTFADGWLQLDDDEAWLQGDATDEALAEGGHGAAVDSRRYGPVPVDALVARAWFRYWPRGRIGRLGRGPAGSPEA